MGMGRMTRRRSYGSGDTLSMRRQIRVKIALPSGESRWRRRLDAAWCELALFDLWRQGLPELEVILNQNDRGEPQPAARIDELLVDDDDTLAGATLIVTRSTGDQ